MARQVTVALVITQVSAGVAGRGAYCLRGSTPLPLPASRDSDLRGASVDALDWRSKHRRCDINAIDPPPWPLPGDPLVETSSVGTPTGS